MVPCVRCAIVAIASLLSFSSPAIADDPDLQQLIEDLADPDESARWSAASDIGELGAAGIEAADELTSLLADPDDFVRSIAADSLLRIGGDAAAIRPLLLDPENDVRLSVARSLLRTGVEIEAATDALVELSAADDLSVDVDNVFMALSQGRARQVAPRLLTIAAEDDSKDMRRSARYEFTQLDVDVAEFVDRLAPLLQSQQIDVRRMAAEFLTTAPSLPESTREPLLNALSDDDDQVRVHVALCLSGFNPVPPDALPEIRRAFKSHDESVVHIVVDEVNRRPELSKQLIPDLIDVLGCGNPFTREDAVEALARMDARNIVPLLIAMVNEPDARITHAYLWEDIAELMSRYGPEAATGIPSLVQLSDYSAVDVRKASLRSLAVVGIRDAAAIACISRHLREDPEEELRIEAARALAAAAGDDETLRIDARKILRERLAASSPNERVAVVEALVQIGEVPRAVLPALKLLLNDENGTVVQQALGVYAQLGPRARTAVPTLVDAFESDAFISAGFGGWMLHQSVPYVLGKVGAAAVPPLIAALEHPNPQVRGHAAEALGLIGPDAAPAVPELMKCLDDLAEFEGISGCMGYKMTVRMEAIRALGRIGPAARPAAARLLELLQDPDEFSQYLGIQMMVAQALAGVGETAAMADALWMLIPSGDTDTQWVALRALAVITPDDPRIISEADRQLRWIADFIPPDSAGGPYLWDELGSLAQEWGPRARPLISTLEYLVTSAPLLETDVRVDAAYALAVIDPANPVGLPYLQREAAYEARIWRSLYLRSAQEALDDLKSMQEQATERIP